MMYNFPFYPHFPTKSYRSYPHKLNKISIDGRNPHQNTYKKNFTSKSDIFKDKNQTYEKSNERNYKNENSKKHQIKFENKYDENFFEILGIKLYSDDILLLCLIFFLYKEGVQDEYLFISLIMLLLS